MDAWTFIWLMLILKIPIVGLFLIVRWAVRQPPEVTPNEDGGIGPRSRPHHPRPRLPRTPRRGPHHGGEQSCSPPRIRSVVARVRSPSR
ncbi:MAG TPA: hypothetical protein VGF15_07810 [Solirubrobacteraceae bacterium]